IRNVIKRLDAATPQVLIQSKVVELTLGSTDRLGIDWNLHVGLNGSSRPTTFPFDATHRSFAERFLPYGRGTTTGAVASGAGSTDTTTIEDFPKGEDGSSIQPTFPVADKAEFTFGRIDFTQMKALLDLIAQRQDAKVLSEPHIMVLNN